MCIAKETKVFMLPKTRIVKKKKKAVPNTMTQSKASVDSRMNETWISVGKTSNIDLNIQLKVT